MPWSCTHPTQLAAAHQGGVLLPPTDSRAWEHVNIQHLAKALGVDEEQIPHWSSEDYDTVYELRYSAPDVKSLTDFRVAKENLTAGGGPAPAPTPPAPTPAGMKWWGLQVVIGFD